MHIQESGEMYLETIYILQKKKSDVRSIDVANELGYSKPSISRAVSILKSNNYINVDKQGSITLTDAGREIAVKIYERHGLLSAFLKEIGVNEETAAQDACRIEHIISQESFEKIKEDLIKRSSNK